MQDDRPAKGQTIDLCVCLEYWSASNPRYIPYKPDAEEGGPAYMRYLKLFGDKQKSSTAIKIGTHYQG